MQNTENQRKTKERYLIVRLWLNNNGNYQINSSYPPTAMHSSYLDAKTEAERLAKTYPGTSFGVFELGGIATVPIAPVQWTTL